MTNGLTYFDLISKHIKDKQRLVDSAKSKYESNLKVLRQAAGYT